MINDFCASLWTFSALMWGSLAAGFGEPGSYAIACLCALVAGAYARVWEAFR